MRRSLRAELVPYGAYESEGLSDAGRGGSVSIPIERASRRRSR